MVIEDRDERPLLIAGLDLLQAAEEPVLKLELNYGKDHGFLYLLFLCAGGRCPGTWWPGSRKAGEELKRLLWSTSQT